MSLANEDKGWIAGAIDARVAAHVSASEQRLIETMRAMQTEILRGLETFARGNFARMVRLETSNAATVEQLAALEERVLRLETRLKPNV
jgi:hypothetical protein